jgi:hypothetical protein
VSPRPAWVRVPGDAATRLPAIGKLLGAYKDHRRMIEVI